MHPKPILILALCLGLSACTADVQPEVEATAAANAPVAIPEPSPEQQAARAEFFSQTQLSAIRSFEESFSGVGSPEALLVMFDRAAGLGNRILPPQEPWDPVLMARFGAFPEADLGIAGLRPTCVAECTAMAFAPDLDDWALVARQTSSDSDDAFIDLLVDYFVYPTFYDGAISGYGRYFEQTWDYGGYSLLGSGAHTELLRQLDSLRSRTPLFNSHLNAWRAQLMGDAVGWNVWVGPDSLHVSEELAALAALTTLTPDDSSAIRKRQAELEARDSPLETNCQDLSCSCSSG